MAMSETMLKSTHSATWPCSQTMFSSGQYTLEHGHVEDHVNKSQEAFKGSTWASTWPCSRPRQHQHPQKNGHVHRPRSGQHTLEHGHVEDHVNKSQGAFKGSTWAST
ncbi:unnamed protein product [Linum trigynum]|uniref:Uncharacterized protein n=1 Tax=Linum trigynum TaxID=586398 RepID=A0AAV2GAP1_9ROSI